MTRLEKRFKIAHRQKEILLCQLMMTIAIGLKDLEFSDRQDICKLLVLLIGHPADKDDFSGGLVVITAGAHFSRNSGLRGGGYPEDGQIE